MTRLPIDRNADDRTLVTMATDGDARAMDLLLRRHQSKIAALCRRITGNDADAADATQDALMAIVRGLNRYDGRAAFTTWAYRVTTNACIDEIRRRTRRPVPVDDEPDISVVSDDGPAFDESLANRLAIDAAMVRIPIDFRTAVVLRDQLGLDYAEIAEVLEIPPGTVRSRIARGRAALADALGNPTAESTVQPSAP